MVFFQGYSTQISRNSARLNLIQGKKKQNQDKSIRISGTPCAGYTLFAFTWARYGETLIVKSNNLQ